MVYGFTKSVNIHTQDKLGKLHIQKTNALLEYSKTNMQNKWISQHYFLVFHGQQHWPKTIIWKNCKMGAVALTKTFFISHYGYFFQNNKDNHMPRYVHNVDKNS